MSRTEAGKLRSSQNSLKHGLASGQITLPGESLAEFESLLSDLTSEYQPATTTESLLIADLAKYYWLKERAISLQNDALAVPEPDLKKLALYLRYQTTNERAFHKSLKTLLDLQLLRQQTPPKFVSQNPIEDTAEALDRDMAAIQNRLLAYLEANPEAAARTQDNPELTALLSNQS